MLLAMGLERRCADVSHREALAVAPEDVEGVLQAFAALGGVDEVAVISTCYRVEVYAASSAPAVAAVSLRRALVARAGGRELPLFERHGEAAIRHLWRVASSLESAIPGEPQVLGQVREAFACATAARTVGRELAALAHRTSAVARRVRSETAIGRAGVSWGNAAASLAEKVLGPLSGRRALLLGAGEMARLTAQHLREQGASLVIVNRTLERAQALAAEVGGTARPLEALEAELRWADVVVSTALAAPAALAPDGLSALMKARRHARLVLVDLAVPRAIPAEAGRLDGVYLCDLDDLERLQAAAMAERSGAVSAAERIVEEEIARWAREEGERRAVPIIRAVRSRAAEIAREEAARTARRLGDDPEVARRLEALAGAIVSKLFHAPSARLRRAGADGQAGEALMAAACEIFDVPAHSGGVATPPLSG
ncbi:MAG TPA: glutamyl-tRNA reductase [Anaeromyxobacteraceae bacterium]|nr:glutamyl-tRNA reductase [Anaeromyxobacteraceae bacterium]